MIPKTAKRIPVLPAFVSTLDAGDEEDLNGWEPSGAMATVF
jgi:hypothetical protein